MAFEESPNVQVERDENGRVRILRHPGEPFTRERAGLTAPSARELADEYVRQVLELYDIDQDEVADLVGEIRAEPSQEGPRLRFGEEKTVLDTTVVSYQQTYFGLPVWQAALEVRVYGDPPRVGSSDSTLHHDIDAPPPPSDTLAAVDGPASLRDTLGLDEATAQGLTINSTRMLVYRYDPDDRVDPTGGEPGLQGGPPVLPLPPVPDTIEPQGHYVVREALFTLPLPGWNDLHWRVFIELETGAVLYLRALAASATACVFATDPVSASGTALNGCSPAASLDPLRTTVTLLGLDPPDSSGSQALRGTNVVLTDTDAPAIAPPATTAPFSFCYSSVTNDFAAASAYHHYEGAYRLVEGMGFNLKSYFDGTTFPVPVDHQGFGTSVNAQAAGNAAGNGMGKFRNGLAATGCPVGIAADVRVVLHEFGHALLWDHVNSPNFGWCHSAGDTLGAILHDPGSKALDRFETFPFISIGRRHDRDVAAGWAWGGAQDDRQYGSEQVLSTTLFRVYRSAGGDNADINVKRFAGRYLAFLIIKAIGTLTVTTTNPAIYVTALMDADESTLSFEGQPGGAWHKVIRWSFERQGLYQPPGAPTPVTQPGDPPPVDVYIDDGRAGGYLPYLANPSVTADIWNRRNADGGSAHEEPTVGVTNHAYVRLKNRGTQAAANVTVKLFQADPAGGLIWPTGWTPASTPQLNAPGSVPPGGQIVVGPFDWTPQIAGDERLLASASAPGDLSNADTVNGSLPAQRLVPLDNNIAMRAVSPIAATQELQLVSSTHVGGMWHTIRHPASWQPFFGDVKGVESNDPGYFTAVGCAGIGTELHVVGLTDSGGMWHTIRHADGSWQPFFGDVKGVESNDPGYFTAVGCAGVAGDLHVVALTESGGMWHTIRHADGSWQSSFGDVKSVEGNDPGYFMAVACTGSSADLHVVATTHTGGMWHTIRHPTSWEPVFGNVKAVESNDPGYLAAVGCAGVGDDVQVVALTHSGGMWHTIRHADGSWQPSFGDVKNVESNNPGHFSAVACGGVTAPATPIPVLIGFTVEPTRLVGVGDDAVGTVILSEAAPVGGTSIALASSRPGLIRVPAQVTIPAGSTEAEFEVLAGQGFGQSSVSATLGAITLKQNVDHNVDRAEEVSGQRPSPKKNR